MVNTIVSFSLSFDCVIDLRLGYVVRIFGAVSNAKRMIGDSYSHMTLTRPPLFSTPARLSPLHDTNEPADFLPKPQFSKNLDKGKTIHPPQTPQSKHPKSGTIHP